jgi:hypothetical protein
MLLSPPGTDGMVTSRDMEVVLPIDDSVGGWVVVHPSIVHHADNNQCGNQTTDQKLHASSGALCLTSSTPYTKGLDVYVGLHNPKMTSYLHMFPACLHTGPVLITTSYVPIYVHTTCIYVDYTEPPPHSLNMPTDFFYTTPTAQQCIWIALLRHTGWDTDDLLKMPIGVILDLMQVIRFEVQQSTNAQAQAWVDECVRYADERGWDLRWFNTIYIAWLLIDCHINYIRMIQSYFRASHPNNNVRHLHITNVNPPKLTKLNTGIVQRRPRQPIV